ncbi:MAG: hypothetical protein IMZ62_00420 [Chloroflexi bacterium]|nr:hypothetical protein [Chloroflexota bacterium]
MSLQQSNENMAYRAARVLLLIGHCGKPRGVAPGVTGRTLLAKLDFFLRYPAFLARAAKALNQDVSLKALGVESAGELTSVESHMVRYRYGPWDHAYYVILAYLIGKGLLVVDLKNRTETFRLTDAGREMADRIGRDPAFADLAERADLVYALFNRLGGTKLKDFIYREFPEVVSRDLGAAI